jgi:hypothetical protein
MLDQLLFIYFIVFLLFICITVITTLRYQKELIKVMRKKGIKDRPYDSEEYLNMFIRNPSLFIKTFYSAPFRYIRMLFKQYEDRRTQELIRKIRWRILIAVLLPIIYFVAAIVTMMIVDR